MDLTVLTTWAGLDGFLLRLGFGRLRFFLFLPSSFFSDASCSDPA
jgi:hypothetical protein